MKIKNSLIAFFVALYFYVKCKYFRYVLMSKCFFGIKFEFWLNSKQNTFQLSLKKKGYSTICDGKFIEFNFSNLYKDLKHLLNKEIQ